jgi:GNAT superfamily N-acetyltransferase
VTSGPAAVAVTDPPPGVARALGSLWIAVTEAGGAVDFVPGWPEDEIRGLAEDLIAAVRAGRSRMIVVGDPADPDGTVFVTPGTGITAHRGEVGRLMVRPDRQGRGLGTVLLDAAVAEGAAMGLELLTLGARGGTSLPEFYRGRGWEPTGVVPRGVRLSPDDARDVHLFHRRTPPPA